jgi:hypothetical protein
LNAASVFLFFMQLLLRVRRNRESRLFFVFASAWILGLVVWNTAGLWSATRTALWRMAQNATDSPNHVRDAASPEERWAWITDRIVLDDAKVWHQRTRTWVREFINVTLDDAPATALKIPITPPVLILGSAGTGTRVFYDLLNHRPGVALTRSVNHQNDAKFFIETIKSTALGIPDGFLDDGHGQSADDISNPHWNQTNSTRQLESALAWLLKLDVEPEMSDEMRANIETFWRILAVEANVRCELEGCDASKLLWGFKEPQAMLVLPYLIQILRQWTHQRPFVIHVVRDGRDVAFSKQQRQRYQYVYIQALQNLFHRSFQR